MQCDPSQQVLDCYAFFIGVQTSLLFSFYLNLFVYKFMINQWRNPTNRSTWWTWCPFLLLLTSYFWYSFWFEMATMVVCQRWLHELIMRWRLIWAKHIGERIYCKDFDFLLFFCVVFLCKNISTSLILATADNEKLLNSMLPLFVFLQLNKSKSDIFDGIYTIDNEIRKLLKFKFCFHCSFLHDLFYILASGFTLHSKHVNRKFRFQFKCHVYTDTRGYIQNVCICIYWMLWFGSC